MIGIRMVRPSPIGVVSVSSPVGAVYSPHAVRSASVTSVRMRLHAARYELPASVNTSRRLDRLNSLVRRCDSRSEIRRLTVASGVPSRRDAADRLPSSATARKVDIASRRSIGAPFQYNEGLLLILACRGDFERPTSRVELGLRIRSAQGDRRTCRAARLLRIDDLKAIENVSEPK